MEAKDPSTWNVQEVAEWLAELGLPQYASAFEAMAVDGMLLFEMTDEDLQNDLNVGVRLHRCKILRCVAQLKDRPAQQQVDDSQQVAWEAISLHAVEGQLTNNTFVIGSAGASVGRNSASNDIVISESFVSRRHCELRFDAPSNQFLIKDLGSTTGTFVMVQAEHSLKKGHLVQMGLSEFEVKNVKFSPYGKAMELELQLFEGPARGQTVAVTDAGLTAGRDPANTLSIPDDSQLSGFHAEIRFDDGQFLLKDLGSTNRTWLRLSAEGAPSDPRPLILDDYLKIGSSVLQVKVPESAALKNLSFKQGDSLPDSLACSICFARECDAAYYPCGHMLCYGCACMCRECPKCRQPYNEIIKVYR